MGFGRRAKIATARCPGAGRGGARDDQGQGQPGSQRGAGTTHERDLLLRGQTCTFRASCKVPGRPRGPAANGDFLLLAVMATATAPPKASYLSGGFLRRGRPRRRPMRLDVAAAAACRHGWV